MRHASLVFIACALAAACGSSPRKAIALKPAVAITDAFVPPTVAGDLTLVRNVDKQTANAFAKAGPASLVADGRIYEVRQGTHLVGVLEIASLKPAVVVDAPTQRSIVAQLMPGAVQRITEGPVTIYSGQQGRLHDLLWFGQGIYELLQLRDVATPPTEVAHDIVKHQLTVAGFVPLQTGEGKRRHPPR